MGLGGISLPQLLIVLLIVVVIFGTAKLTSIGKDLGGAVKGFRNAMSDESKDPAKITEEAEEAEASAKQNAESKQS